MGTFLVAGACYIVAAFSFYAYLVVTAQPMPEEFEDAPLMLAYAFMDAPDKEPHTSNAA